MFRHAPRETTVRRLLLDVLAKARADPRRRSGRTRAIKIFMVKSAYRSIRLSGMSQAEARRELSFSISASQSQGHNSEARHRPPLVRYKFDLCVSRNPG